MNNKTRWIARTAIFLALLVAVQYVTAGLGNQFITGSLVNLILIISVMTCGLASGAVVSLVSPFLAFFLNIGPALVQLVPLVALGNFTIVLVWHLLGNRTLGNRYVSQIIALASGAVAKFLVLYFTVVKLAVPALLPPESPAVAVMSLNFSYPQLITASIGGVIAILILPTLQKAIKKD